MLFRLQLENQVKDSLQTRTMGSVISSQEDTMAAGCAYSQGRFVPVADASISILDYGFLHSDATYDVVHVWDGHFFRLQDHLARFFSCMQRLRLQPEESPKQIEEILHECARRTSLTSAYVMMLCTRGVPPAGSRDPRQCRSRFYAFAVPFSWIATPEKQETGLHLKVSRHQRIQPESVDPTIKNFHWMDMTRALMEALDEGGETAVLVDGADNVVEGPGFNIFAVVDGQLVTPARGMLEGITRQTSLNCNVSNRLTFVLANLQVLLDVLE